MKDKKTYEEFKNEYVEKMSDYYKFQGLEAHLQEQYKANQKVEGVVVQSPDINISPIIYIEPAYEAYQKGTSMQEIMTHDISMLNQAMREVPSVPRLDADYIMQNSYMVLMNYERNKEMLKNAPHERVQDLAKVPKLKIGDNGSTTITFNLLGSAGLTGNEVLGFAEKNTKSIGYSFQSLNAVLKDMMIQDGFPAREAELMFSEAPTSLYVLSNPEKYHGAIAMADKDILKSIKAELGEDFYILPSSRHEVLVAPTSIIDDPKDLENMIHEVNAAEVALEDQLSESLYKFDGKALSIVNTEVIEKAEVLELTEKIGRGR